MESLRVDCDIPQANEALVGEIIRIFSQLPHSEQRSVLRSFSILAKEPSMNCINHGLTRRECQVLVLVANGYTRREIGSALKISANTAASHITNIYRKLDVSTTAEAVRAAIAMRLVD